MLTSTESPANIALRYPESLEFLARLTEAAIESARVPAGSSIAGNGQPPVVNKLGFTAIRPGGRDCYPAIWVQDFTMICASGFVTEAEMAEHLHLIACRQNGPIPRHLHSGAVIPAYAIPDHINLDGSPVFFPGTYSPGEDQGGETFGLRPPVNNHYDFIWLAHQLWTLRGADTTFLKESVDGIPLFERLLLAFGAPEHDESTGLVETEDSRRAVGFIFCDTVYMTGKLHFASLLRWRAAGHLAELMDHLKQPATCRRLREEMAKIERSLPAAFSSPETTGGWLRAATGTSGQADVWGTIYALYLGILAPATRDAARAQLVSSLEQGTIQFEGALRHVPLDMDASPTSAWERSSTLYNRYQNGAYWHMPTGWLIAVLAEYAPQWATRVFDDFIAHLRRESFLRGAEFGAPWECIGWNGLAKQNSVFVPSLTVPYQVLSRML